MLAAKAEPGRKRIPDVISTPIPAFVVVPCGLDAGLGIIFLDVIVRERITTDVVFESVVSRKLYLLLILLIAVEYHLVWLHMIGVDDFHLEVFPLHILLEIARHHEWFNFFEVSVGQSVTGLELRLGVFVLLHPVIKRLLRVGRSVAALSLSPCPGLSSKQSTRREQ